MGPCFRRGDLRCVGSHGASSLPPGFALQATPGAARKHASSPLFFGRPGAGPRLSCLPLSLRTKKRAERQGVSPRPRRHAPLSTRLHVPEHMAPCAGGRAHGKLPVKAATSNAATPPAFRTRRINGLPDSSGSRARLHLTKYGRPHRIAGPLGPSALGAGRHPSP